MTKNKLIIILSVLVAVLFVALLYLLSSNNQKITSISTPIPTSTPIFPEWATYENKEYGFSFEYPKSGKISIDSDVSRDIYVNIDNLPFNFSLAIEKNPKVICDNGTKKEIPQTSENLNCFPALHEKVNFLGYPMDIARESDQIVTYAFLANNTLYEFRTFSVSQNDFELVRKIVFSFRFSDQSKNFVNWKTYENKNFGLSFKYPNSMLLDSFSTFDNLSFSDKKNKSKLLILINADGFSPTQENFTYNLDYSDGNGIIVNNVEEKKDILSENTEDRLYINSSTNIKDVPFFFSYFYPKSNPNQRFVFDQILSTFKFLPNPNQLKTYKIEKNPEFKKSRSFSITAPLKWEVKTDLGFVSIKDNGYELSISQPYEYGRCVYYKKNEDIIFDEKHAYDQNIVGNYQTLKTPWAYLRYHQNQHITKVSDFINFLFCSSTDGVNFSQLSPVGWINYEVPVNYDQKTIEEMNNILKSIKVSP